jgi:signal transduction histidine kinase
MELTTAIPLHFTIETLLLSAAGLVMAWSGLRRLWPATLSALVFVVAQMVHAGRFAAEDDDPLVFVLRVIGLVGMAAFILPVGTERRLLGAGLLTIAGATLWSAAIGDNGVGLNVPAHLLFVAGSVVLLVWVWRATRPSVRMRVLAAFVAVLAVTVVVAGGAVARVAAVNSRDEQFAQLARGATAVRGAALDARDHVRTEAAALSPVVAIGLSRGAPSLDRSRISAGDWAIVVDAKRKVVLSQSLSGVAAPYSNDETSDLAVVESAMTGTQSTADVASGALHVIAAAPVYRPGGRRVVADVIGTILIGRRLDLRQLSAATGIPDGELVLVGPDDIAYTNQELQTVPASSMQPGAVSLESIETGMRDWLGAIVAIPESDARAVVATEADAVADAATDLVRAFLIAILAAALLAVVAALWLSARIARPMLDLADEAERVKSDFLANVSHELRTPLTPIRGYTDLLRRGRIPQRDASGYLDEIGVAAQRLERIVALLLDVAAIEAGRLWVDAEEVAPPALLDEASERWSGRSRAHTIRVRAPKSIPNVHADASLIGRVLDELIDNALKFSPGGEVELEARATDAGVEFEITDDGPGIDPDRLEALRSAFSQAESGDTRRFGGLGLGLAFVEGVLIAHGAQLEITSDVGSGTACSFVLPRAGTGSVSPMRAVAATKRARSSGTASQKPR